jgi:hypothetical protein
MQKANESGAVSMLTVIFFMIMLSVLMISFVRVVVFEVTQARDNELKASALAAAYGGLEDAKRVLVYCGNNPTADGCDKVLVANPGCDQILQSALASTGNETVIRRESNLDGGNGDGIIDSSGAYQQRYTCLRIITETSTYENQVGTDKSLIVPLKFTGSPTSVQLSWHRTGSAGDSDSDGVYVASPGGETFPKVDAWKSDLSASSLAPAVLRAELVTVPKSGSVTPETLAEKARAVTLRPQNNADNTAIQFSSYEPKSDPNQSATPLAIVRCSNTSPYACTVKLQVDGTGGKFDIGANDYYLRIQSIYRSTHVELTPSDGVKFDNLQPEVDVTGRTNDIFRRIRARVSLGKTGKCLTDGDNCWFPEYAIESEKEVCKNMFVQPDSGTDYCGY